MAWIPYLIISSKDIPISICLLNHFIFVFFIIIIGLKQNSQKTSSNMNQFLRKSSIFLLLTGGVYFCYLISGVYHEKLLKKPYKHIITGKQAYCSESLIFTIFPPLVGSIIGQIILWFTKINRVLPWKKCAVVSAIVNFNMFTYNQAVVQASFPAVVMVKSCSLLSVIIVAVFFSRVKDSKLKLTHQKLLIGFVATFGIILFNFFKKQEKGGVDRPIQLISFGNLFLLMSLIGDGFLPDFQAQLKSQYKPSTIEMYCQVNKLTFLIAFLLASVSFRIPIIWDFLMNYESFAADIAKLSVLNSIGQLFIYKMIQEFRQHIPPFVIALRKCLTVIVNILWFNHSINYQQMTGILLVFIAVFWEVISNYKQGQKKNEKIQKIEYSVQAEVKELGSEKPESSANNLQVIQMEGQSKQQNTYTQPQLIENKT